MKKTLFFIIVSVSLLLTGCDKKESGTMICGRKDSQGNVSMDFSYTVEYENGFVTKIESNEIIISDNSSLLDTYKKKIEEQNEPYKDIEYYDFNISIKDNTLTNKTKIDYNKIDTSKMIEIDPNNGTLIKNGKISIDSIKTYYESLKITCKK